jgi:hypothetical protein
MLKQQLIEVLSTANYSALWSFLDTNQLPGLDEYQDTYNCDWLFFLSVVFDEIEKRDNA